MANYATLKAAIQDVVKTNGNNEITGALLQQSLLTMIDSLGVGYQFMGVAIPSTDPGTPDQRVYYLAAVPGTYVNFGSIVITELSILKYNGSWIKEEIDIVSNIITMVDKRLNSVFDSLAPWAFKGTPSIVNPIFRDIWIGPGATAGVAALRVGTSSQILCMLSPIIDLGEIGSTYELTFSAGVVSSGNFPCLVLLDENMEYYLYWSQTTIPRTVTGVVSNTVKFARLVFPAEQLVNAYIKRGDEFLFNGGDINTSQIGTKEQFFESDLISDDWKQNSRGDFIGWNFADSDSAQTAQRTVYNYPIYRRIGINATQLIFSISKLVELPKNTSITLEFSCGVVDTGLMLRLINPITRTASYYGANENPRTVTIDSATWPFVQLYFRTANYANCYIKDITNNVVLWEGSNSIE